MDDVTRFVHKIREITANKKYTDEHRVHTDDCMSPWGEGRRGIMTPETIVENHRLHMADAAANADYRRNYAAGYRSGQRGVDVLDRADADGRTARPGWIEGYEDAAAGRPRRPQRRVERGMV